MGLALIYSRGQAGLTAYEVSVEAHIAGGLPSFAITGLPTMAVRESKDRVRAALQTSGITLPARKITIHLGPAEIPKDGGRFDLPIALALIKAGLKLPWETDKLEFLGELTLGGRLRAISGALPAAIAAAQAKRTLFVPAENAIEAAIVEDARVHAADHLQDVLDHLNGITPLAIVPRRTVKETRRACSDLADVRDQPAAKRALTIAAAGGHNLLMVGAPGTGKSMLAERLRSLLPDLSHEDFLEVACVRSLRGGPVPNTYRPPFRAPHHTISAQALVGGGARPRPGEVSLANRGVLFLDELPEFSRPSIEALREPMETRQVRVARVLQHCRFPADFQLVAAMNPCACGYFGDGTDRCCCSPARIASYRSRISGPILDRFDLQIHVARVHAGPLSQAPGPAESPRIRERVTIARDAQIKRQRVLNSKLDDGALWPILELPEDAASLIETAVDKWRLSARGIVRVYKVARTIADLAEKRTVESAHIAEALQLRCLDRLVR